MEDFGELLIDYNRRLVDLDDNHTSEKHAPGKWSKKEILGHLVDSAINNYARFVTVRNKDDMVLSGYDQDLWVESQNYQAISYWEVVELWLRMNQQIDRLIRATPAEIMGREYKTNNLDVICSQKLDHDTPATLRYLFGDYVGHMEYHLGQILT